MQPQANIDRVYDKLKHLTPSRMIEVEDFVDFLSQRSQDNTLVQAAQTAAEPVLERIWNNDEDAAYDGL